MVVTGPVGPVTSDGRSITVLPDEITDEDLNWLNDQLTAASSGIVFSNLRQPRHGGAAPHVVDTRWVRTTLIRR